MISLSKIYLFYKMILPWCSHEGPLMLTWCFYDATMMLPWVWLCSAQLVFPIVNQIIATTLLQKCLICNLEFASSALAVIDQSVQLLLLNALFTHLSSILLQYCSWASQMVSLPNGQLALGHWLKKTRSVPGLKKTRYLYCNKMFIIARMHRLWNTSLAVSVLGWWEGTPPDFKIRQKGHFDPLVWRWFHC